jgi:hypothetical protein
VNAEVIQVVVIPAFRGPLERWLAQAGLELVPIPNGRDADGRPAFTDDDLPTYCIGPTARPRGGRRNERAD